MVIKFSVNIDCFERVFTTDHREQHRFPKEEEVEGN